MRHLTPRLPVGFDDVAARAQMNIVEQIFSGRRNTGGHSRFLEQAKSLACRVFACPLGKLPIKFLARFSAGLGREFCVAGPRLPISFAMLCHSVRRRRR